MLLKRARRSTPQRCRTEGEPLPQKAGEQVFQRAVSKAELEATLSSCLLRGGREGRDFFTSSASLDAKRAQIRIGLDARYVMPE